jgi:hypothetical protein
VRPRPAHIVASTRRTALSVSPRRWARRSPEVRVDRRGVEERRQEDHGHDLGGRAPPRQRRNKREQGAADDEHDRIRHGQLAGDAGGGPAGLAHAPTLGIEAVICRGSNNYPPRQQPEKLIALCLLNALNGDSLPRNGDGRHIRNYVNDVFRALHTVLLGGRPGEPTPRVARRMREHRGGAPHPGAGRSR